MTNLKKIAITLFALLVITTSMNAKPVTPANPFLTDDPFTVKYIGNEGDYILVEVIVHADNTRNTSFGISDKTEGEIYSSRIWSAYKVQTIKIEKRDQQELNFKLTIGKVEYSRSFAILSTVKMEKI